MADSARHQAEPICALAALGFSEVSRRSVDWDYWREASAPYPSCMRWVNAAVRSVRSVQTDLYKDDADALGLPDRLRRDR